MLNASGVDSGSPRGSAMPAPNWQPGTGQFFAEIVCEKCGAAKPRVIATYPETNLRQYECATPECGYRFKVPVRRTLDIKKPGEPRRNGTGPGLMRADGGALDHA